MDSDRPTLDLEESLLRPSSMDRWSRSTDALEESLLCEGQTASAELTERYSYIATSFDDLSSMKYVNGYPVWWPLRMCGVGGLAGANWWLRGWWVLYAFMQLWYNIYQLLCNVMIPSSEYHNWGPSTNNGISQSAVEGIGVNVVRTFNCLSNLVLAVKFMKMKVPKGQKWPLLDPPPRSLWMIDVGILVFLLTVLGNNLYGAGCTVEALSADVWQERCGASCILCCAAAKDWPVRWWFVAITGFMNTMANWLPPTVQLSLLLKQSLATVASIKHLQTTRHEPTYFENFHSVSKQISLTSKEAGNAMNDLACHRGLRFVCVLGSSHGA